MIWHAPLYEVKNRKNVKFLKNLHTSSSRTECLGAVGVYIFENLNGRAIRIVNDPDDPEIVGILIYNGDYITPARESIQEVVVILHE